jgi:hypothetical protein
VLTGSLADVAEHPATGARPGSAHARSRVRMGRDDAMQTVERASRLKGNNDEDARTHAALRPHASHNWLD